MGLTLIVAGCGPAGASSSGSGAGSSASGGAGGGGSSAACNLFTDAEISTAVGRTYNKHDGVDSTLMGQSICTYQGPEAGRPIAVAILYTANAMKTDLSVESSATHIDGLGDDAFWTPVIGRMFARKGSHAMYIVDPASGSLALTSGDNDNATTRDAFKALVQQALPKI